MIPIYTFTNIEQEREFTGIDRGDATCEGLGCSDASVISGGKWGKNARVREGEMLATMSNVRAQVLSFPILS